MSMSDINKMSTAQKLYLMEQLWDSLRQDEDALTSPAWHKTVLEERKKRYENGELKMFSLDEIRASFNR